MVKGWNLVRNVNINNKQVTNGTVNLKFEIFKFLTR